MSDSCWTRWIELFLFGGSALPSPLPPALRTLVLRLEAENIPWQHVVSQGGFTAFPYQIHGDLNYLTDHLEKQWLLEAPFHEPAPFKTRAVSKFWIELQTLLSRRDEPSPLDLPRPSERDEDVLRDLLEAPRPGPRPFQSAAFWGEVARRCIDLRRPETLSACSAPAWSSEHALLSRRLLQLYDVTCAARGRSFDPFHLVLVHHSEHVAAAHWQTSENLEAWMRDRPRHALTRSVQALLSRTVDDLLRGRRPSALLDPRPTLDAFLHNVGIVHESVDKGSHETAPPRLIDVFHRLLVLGRRDQLWEKKIPVAESDTPNRTGTSLFYLTQQLRLAERERRLLWTQVIPTRDEEESGPVPTSRICSEQRLCARDRCRP